MSAGGFGSPVFDFTSLDFESVRADLERYAQQVFPTQLWTDFNESNFGTYLLELMAYATDLAAFNLNASVLETVPITVVREQNFRNIGKTLNFALKSASPSSGTVRVNDLIATPPAYTFTVTTHYRFTSPDGYVFQPVADVAVVGQAVPFSVDIPVIQGDEHYQEVMAVSNGKPNQAYPLASTYMIDGTLTVEVGALTYTLIENFIAAGPTDTVYTIATSDTGITTVTFGDGINGRIPPNGQNLFATYKTGGGIETNLAAGTAMTVEATTADGLPTAPQLLVGSAEILATVDGDGTTGGGPAQTLTNAKQALPLSLKANYRAVTLQDYSSLALQIAGVLKASALSGKPVGGAKPIILLIVPNGGGDPSPVLANNVVVGLNDLKLAGKKIRVQAPVYVELNIEAAVQVKQSAFSAVVAGRLKTLLTAKYALDVVDFGAFFGLQDLYDSTDPVNVPGSQSILYKRFTITPYFARHLNVPTSGNGVVEHISVNGLVQRREWFITIVPPGVGVLVNQFTVQQRRIGVSSFVAGGLMADDQASYVDGELVGKFLLPNPDDNTTAFPISANTSTTITAGGNQLPLFMSPGDPYVVQELEPVVGKLLRTRLSVAAVGTNTIDVTSSASWQIGDPLIIWDPSIPTVQATVTGIPNATQLTISGPPVSAPLNAVVDYLWRSDDQTTQFVVVDGPDVIPALATPQTFSVGDSLYVDTFPIVGDLQLRAETFPLFDPSALIPKGVLTITTSGGVK